MRSSIEEFPAVDPESAARPVSHPARAGLVFALGAYLSWGVIPSYFKLLADVPPLVVLAHRIVWSVFFLAALLTLQREWASVLAAVRARRTLIALCCSTLAIAVNWYVFIWAVSNGKVLHASLGYFINPLVSVLLGVLILRERLGVGQVIGLLLATIGVLILTLTAGGVPWVALSLAFSFGLYGLLRKVTPVGPLVGLSVETGILFPAAVLIVFGFGPALRTTAGLPFSSWTYGLLVAAGVITAIPLLLFAAGARRLKLSTLGFLQYLAPTCQFCLAVFAYHEPFSSRQLLSFAFIWAALVVYTLESVVKLHQSRRSINRSQFEPAAVPAPE